MTAEIPSACPVPSTSPPCEPDLWVAVAKAWAPRALFAAFDFRSWPFRGNLRCCWALGP